MVFKIEKLISDEDYIISMHNSQFKCTSISTIARYLHITKNDFDNAIKLYNGFYSRLAFVNGFEFKDDDNFKSICFKNKEDAKKFIAEYIEPLLVINSIDK